jgi:hypothetical protein
VANSCGGKGNPMRRQFEAENTKIYPIRDRFKVAAVQIFTPDFFLLCSIGWWSLHDVRRRN